MISAEVAEARALHYAPMTYPEVWARSAAAASVKHQQQQQQHHHLQLQQQQHHHQLSIAAHALSPVQHHVSTAHESAAGVVVTSSVAEFLRPAPKTVPANIRYNGMSNGGRHLSIGSIPPVSTAVTSRLSTGKYPSQSPVGAPTALASAPVNLTQPHKAQAPEDVLSAAVVAAAAAAAAATSPRMPPHPMLDEYTYRYYQQLAAAQHVQQQQLQAQSPSMIPPGYPYSSMFTYAPPPLTGATGPASPMHTRVPQYASSASVDLVAPPPTTYGVRTPPVVYSPVGIKSPPAPGSLRAERKPAAMTNAAAAASSFKVPSGKEGSMKHRILTRPEDAVLDLQAKDFRKRLKSSISPPEMSPLSTHNPSSLSPTTKLASPPSQINNNTIAATNNLNLLAAGTHALPPRLPTLAPPPAPISSSVTAATPASAAATTTMMSFVKGTFVELGSGELRLVEDMRTEDFVNSAACCPALRLAESTVVRITENPLRTGMAAVKLSYNDRRSEVEMECAWEHPYFVIGASWASCRPELTYHVYGLRVAHLRVGDLVVSLVPRESTTLTAPAAPPLLNRLNHSSSNAHLLPPPSTTMSLVDSLAKKRSWTMTTTSGERGIGDDERHLQGVKLEKIKKIV